MTILMCAQKLTDASLIYRTGPKTKTSKMKKLKKLNTYTALRKKAAALKLRDEFHSNWFIGMFETLQNTRRGVFS